MTAASATAITADEVIDLFYSLKAPYRKNAVWLLNDATVKQNRKIKDSTGQYLWQPSLVAGTPDTIPGRPVKTSAFIIYYKEEEGRMDYLIIVIDSSFLPIEKLAYGNY